MKLESMRESDAKHYQLQVLRIPGILLEAFWLPYLTHEADLFMPVLTRSEKLREDAAVHVPGIAACWPGIG